MTQQPRATRRFSTASLLTCGIVAGPLFVTLVLIQGMLREGFRLSFHPLSLLALGDAGWVQIVNFVATGLLYVGFAAGMRRALAGDRGQTWAPLMFGLVGVGLVASGVFVTDAGAGFPPSSPEGAPEQMSWHGILHTIGFLLANLGWIGGTLVLARRFHDARDRLWTAACLLSVTVVVAIVAQPLDEDFALRGLIATGVSFGFTTALATRLRAELLEPNGQFHRVDKPPHTRYERKSE